MEQLTLEQTSINYHNAIYGPPKDFKPIELTERQHANNIHHAFKAGAEWQKEQYKELLHLYEQIATAYFFRHFNESQLLVGYTNSELLTKIKKLSELLRD